MPLDTSTSDNSTAPSPPRRREAPGWPTVRTTDGSTHLGAYFECTTREGYGATRLASSAVSGVNSRLGKLDLHFSEKFDLVVPRTGRIAILGYTAHF